MSILQTLQKHIEKKNELAKTLQDEYETIKKMVETITKEDVKDMSYEDMKSLYENIYSYSSFTKHKDWFVPMLEEKKIKIYPELALAFLYPILNSLDLPKDIIKKLDDALAHMRVGSYIMKNSSLWRPLSPYIENLVDLGIVERVYEIVSPEIDDFEDDDYDYKTLVKESDLELHKKVWGLYEILKDVTDKADKEEIYEEIDKYEVDGYGYIYLNGYEITTLEEYEKTQKNILYKVILQADRTKESI